MFDMLTEGEQRTLAQMRDIKLDSDIAEKYNLKVATPNRAFFEKVGVLDGLRVIENMLDKNVTTFDKMKALIKVKIF